MQNRFQAITYLKCFAALFVIYVHIDSLLPEPIQSIAKGGILVNSLFFFISGFCLTNVKASFLQWYWKRMVRVLIPYFLLLPLIAFSANPLTFRNVQLSVITLSYHFIPAILFLYVFYYLAVRFRQRVSCAYTTLVVGVIAVWAIYLSFLWDPSTPLFRHLRPNELTVFFLSMLIGALTREKIPHNLMKRFFCVILFLAATCAFIVIRVYKPQGYWRILEAPIPIVWVYSLAHLVLSLNDRLPRIQAVETIANLTLEMYLVQFCCIKAYENIGFPTNLVYLLISVFAIAYALQYISQRVIAKIPASFPQKTNV